MPKDGTGTRDTILQAGLAEFLAKGFTDASLRGIAAAAGVTTGAIYGYYPDKAALFAGLVEPAAGDFKKMFLTLQRQFEKLPHEKQIESMGGYGGVGVAETLGYVYQHYNAFRLIVCCSAGTAYEHYIDDLVSMEVWATENFIEVLRQSGYSIPPLPPRLAHILSSAYFSAVFETVAHNMTKTEASRYTSYMNSFFVAGWKQILGLL